MKRQTGNGSTSVATCKKCRHFRDDPFELEKMFPSILILSSTYGSTRGSAGVCRIHETFHNPEPACSDFLSR